MYLSLSHFLLIDIFRKSKKELPFVDRTSFTTKVEVLGFLAVACKYALCNATVINFKKLVTDIYRPSDPIAFVLL